MFVQKSIVVVTTTPSLTEGVYRASEQTPPACEVPSAETRALEATVRNSSRST
jgi:hypothetical protein